MMRRAPWLPAARADWDALPVEDYLPLTQAWAWGDAKRQTGSRIERYAFDGRVGVQLERRRAVAWAAAAPIGASDDGIGSALDGLSQQLKTPILLSPVVATPSLGAPVSRALFLSGTVCLDLHFGVEDLRDHLDKRWRNGLSKALRSDAEVAEGSLDELLAMLEQLADRKGFEIPYDEPFLRALLPAFGEGCTIRIARHAGVGVGGWMDLRAGSTTTYLLGATTDEGRAVNASYLLLWDAVERHRGDSTRFLDLGGIDSDRTTGASGFKVRTGGRVVDFPGTYLVGGGLRARAVKSWLGLRRLRARTESAAPSTLER